MIIRLTGIIVLVLLAGCGGEEYQDLRQWVKESGNGLKGRVEPLPQVKPYEAITYNAFDLSDPFKPRKIEPTKGSGANQPDLNRRKEALEAYPLESLKMVGTLQQGKLLFGLIKTPDNNLYKVKIGNYMGQSFGIITDVSDSEITIRELIQDTAGDWTERTSKLQLAGLTGAEK